MSSIQHYTFNQPFVVSELIDGEAVIMNLKSGNYYSARHTGALVWDCLEKGLTDAAMAASFAKAYGGLESDYLADISVFIDSLLEQELIIPVEADGVIDPVTADDSVNWPKSYKPPLLEVYADMQDLLLLDPIHDIDEVGWPVAKPTRPTEP